MNAARVGIVGILQESNTFVTSRTSLAEFRDDLLLSGSAIRSKMMNAPHEIGGFFEGLQSAGIEAVPIFLARAVPHGIIEATAFDDLVRQLLTGIRAAGPLDGILAAPHGATVAENAPDADGFWLNEVRHLVGPDVPIIATVDCHANLSVRMVESTDALIAYATNPHVDQRETGLNAAGLMARTLSGEIKPTQAAVFPQMVVNIQSQNTDETPLRDLYSWAAGVSEDVLSASILLGFPYADVPEMGSSVVVVTDDDAAQARSVAAKIGNQMYLRRKQFEPRFKGPLDAVNAAMQSRETPVVLLDMGDNVGGGAPGNSTSLLHELRVHGIGPAFACLADPASVGRVIDAGVGGRLDDFAVGDPTSPFFGDFKVRSIHDGLFSESEARHGGYRDFDQGRTAVLETTDNSLTLMLTTRRVPPFSLRQMTAFDVDPSDYRMIIAKGVIAPMAAYKSVALGGFIHVDSPGPTRANMTKLSYRHRRKPLFPFESDGGY